MSGNLGKSQPRVVSLLPSATDIIAVAGAVDQLVGRSHECNWPSGVERLPILTGAVNQFVSSKQMDDVVNSSLQRGEGLYFLEQELLKELKPDVIVTQDLCNVCSVDLQLVQKTVDQLSIKPKIVTLNPQKLSDVLEDIVRVGKAVGCQQQSEATVAALEQRVRKAQEVAKRASNSHKPLTVAFVEWLDPLFTGGHWTPEMIKLAGATHPLNMPIGEGGAGPSKRIPNQALVDADCDWIIVCPCGFTIEDTKKEEDLLSTKSWWQNLRAVKEGRVAIVDGNQMFARPGPRLVDALEFLVGLLHNSPALIPADFPWTWWDTQKATALAEFRSESPPVHTNGKADSTTVANSSSGNDADVCTLVPNGSSSSSTAHQDIVGNSPGLQDSGDSQGRALPGTGPSDASDKSTTTKQSSQTSQSGGVKQASEQSGGSTPQGDRHKAGQRPSKQTGQASPNSGGIKSGEQSGSVHQNGGGSKARQQAEQQATGQSGSAPQEDGDGAVGQQAAEGRKWGAAPFLGSEIEEAHAAAIAAGQPTYTDPATGYKVITEQNLRQQSVCCANRCRHCPFGHFKVPASRGSRINTITRPTLLKINRKDAPDSTNGLVLWTGRESRCQADASGSGVKGSNGTPTSSSSHDTISGSMPTQAVSTLDSSQGTSSSDSRGSLESGSTTDEETAKAVCVAVFAQESGKVWGSASLTLHDAMNDCLESGHALIAIPSCQHQSSYSMTDAEYADAAAQRLLC